MTVEIMIMPDLPMQPQIFLAAQALLDGQVIVFPTETVYGIAADALHDAAIEHLIAIKGRTPDKPLPVMVADLATAETIVELGNARTLAADFWPGPLTLVLPAKASLNPACEGDGTIGIRCPDHPVAQAILKSAGIPLAVTSANAATEPPATTSLEARRIFSIHDIAFKILQSTPTRGQVSTVLHVTPKVWTILRKGPITAETIRTYLPQGTTLCENN